MTRVSIINVEVEVVKPGPRGYSKATVSFIQDGRNRTQNIMSFVNPQVFKDVKNYIGLDAEVEIGKNEKGYDEWKQIKAADGVAPSAQPQGTAPATRVTGSNYETREERARRQVLIVKQSSLSNAIDYYKNAGNAAVLEEDVMATAQRFADWVFAQEEITNDQEAGASE